MLTGSSLKSCVRIFTGIQPTGIPHLGNYFGVISGWIDIINERKVTHNNVTLNCDKPILSVVDVHAYSTLKDPKKLYSNILSMTASLIALGVDPDKCILFKQSDILEHNYLDNVLDNFVGPARLTRMTQFKDKSSRANSFVSNSLLNYPILQTADILLYRTDLVPVGHDQVQHIELARDIARKFNSNNSCDLFPIPEPLLNETSDARRVKSLRDPGKKMSKSDADKRAFVEVIEEPDIIVDKLKKSLTDSISNVYYDDVTRPAVSNLMRLYHLATGLQMNEISDKFCNNTTAEFKLALADVLIDRFSYARNIYRQLMADPQHIENILDKGADEARPIAEDTVMRVKQLMGSIR